MTDARSVNAPARDARSARTGKGVRASSQSSEFGQKTFVVDTSVLLSDPWAVTRFGEHHVVLPLVVISELEAKRHHHELGWFAREALRMLDDFRVQHGRLDQEIPVGVDGGTL